MVQLMRNSGIRKLAAIMFTDMVGYTALMQKNEQKAKANRDRHRQILESAIGEHNGSLLQYYGDGTLSIFNSAIDAVSSAVQIQRNLQEDPKIPLRIGIHSGDIVHDEEGIYGDGVNIASRIESMAISGSILISGKVFDEIKNHSQFKTKSLGPYQLKNVDHPIRLYALMGEGCVVPEPADLKGKGTSVLRTIAVMPFVNMSADPENEYFSDGITEEILNALVKVEGLQVTSRTSSFALKNQSLNVQEIGNRLNVNSVLEGSVRKAGNKVRITAQLINVADDYHLWSEVYNRQLEDIFDVQDEISRKIVNQLRVKLKTVQSNDSIIKAPTNNLDAYNAYLKGKFFLNKWTPQGAKKAIEFFEEAIRTEEDFPLPYSYLAYAYTMLGAMGQMPPQQAFPKGKEMAIKALDLDDGLAESHVSLALTKIFYEWDLEGARKSIEKAMELNPGSADIHHATFLYFWAVNQPNKALTAIKKACELDPLSLIMNQHLGEAFTLTEEYDKALEQLDKTLHMDPTFRPAFENKGWVFVEKRDYENAIEAFLKFHKLTGHPLKGLAGLGYAYGISGKTGKAEECLQKLEKRAQVEPEVMLDMDYVVIYTGLKKTEKILYHLEESLKQHSSVLFIKTAPIFEDLRKDPRYKQLMNKYGYS